MLVIYSLLWVRTLSMLLLLLLLFVVHSAISSKQARWSHQSGHKYMLSSRVRGANVQWQSLSVFTTPKTGACNPNTNTHKPSRVIAYYKKLSTIGQLPSEEMACFEYKCVLAVAEKNLGECHIPTCISYCVCRPIRVFRSIYRPGWATTNQSNQTATSLHVKKQDNKKYSVFIFYNEIACVYGRPAQMGYPYIHIPHTSWAGITRANK